MFISFYHCQKQFKSNFFSFLFLVFWVEYTDFNAVAYKSVLSPNTGEHTSGKVSIHTLFMTCLLLWNKVFS